MNVYEKYGVQPILNLDGPLTRYGGAIMEQETLDAMDEAAKYTVPIDRLQAAASKVIARITHAEAGIVTSGAFSALTLATVPMALIARVTRGCALQCRQGQLSRVGSWS